MKKVFQLCLIVFFGFLTSCNQKPVEIYVAVNGDDSAAGSMDNPVKSIEKARELTKLYISKKAINIVFEDGIYYLPETMVFEPEHSGKKKYPVVFRAANEGKAIISGGMYLNLKWEVFKNGIYKANISDDVTIDQLYVDGARQRMARFPNAVEGKNVFDTWDLKHTQDPDPDNDPLDTKRVSSWMNPEGAYIHAMHKALWGDMHWLVEGKNTDDTLILEGGWQNNRPSPMHPRYRMVENIFEELDAPGEWYFNKNEKTLYYFPQPQIDLNNARIEIVVLKHLIEFNGTKENPVSFIRFDGFVFRHTARTFMENKEPLLRSDWTTYRGGAVVFNGAEDCVISNCEFDQVGGNSIFVNNYNRRIMVKGCHIHQSGANGVAFVGDPATVRSPLFRYGKQDYENIDRIPGLKGDNYPEDCLVEDCLITMTGRDEKQTAGVQISMSHNIRVSHCSVYDVPRAGINISEGTFGGHIIEYCDVFNTVLETGDHGSFNSWGRDRYWTPDNKQTLAEVAKEPKMPFWDMLGQNIIRNSRWRCDHGWDIDLDDGSSWYRIYNNVLLNGGLKMREGFDRIATNNVIINNSLHPHVWYTNSGDVFAHNIVYGPYKPAIMARSIAPDGKWGNNLDSNLFASSQEDKVKFLLNGCDINSLVGDPLFVDAPKGDFRVKDGSPALQISFKNFDMGDFGVQKVSLKSIAKTPEIPSIKISEAANDEAVSFYSGSIKNLTSDGEVSATGMPGKTGVLVLKSPNQGVFNSVKLNPNDVILKVNGSLVKNVTELISEINKEKIKTMTLWRNQEEIQLKF